MDNPLLALQVQPANIDVAGSIGRGQELRTQRLGNLLQAYQLKKAQEDDQQANALAGFYKQHGSGIASGNAEDINALAAIDPNAAMAFKSKGLEQQKTTGEIAKSEVETQKAHLDIAKTRADMLASTAASILDAPPAARPLLYQRAIQAAKEQGIDVSGAPPQYDEQAVKGMMGQALTVKDRIEQHQKDLVAAEASRHNKAEEGISVRGQNLADARAKEVALTGRIPTGYRAGANGTLEYIPGGPADPTRGAGKKAPTEDQAKNNQLYQRASQQLPIALQHFDALSNPINQAGAAIPVIGGAATTSGEYQQANNAVMDIAASYLYSVSGATANPGEVKNLAQTITPKLGDSKATVAEKKSRLQQMVESIKTRATPTADAPLPVGTKVINFNDLPEK